MQLSIKQVKEKLILCSKMQSILSFIKKLILIRFQNDKLLLRAYMIYCLFTRQ
jgi:hypothetical protein